MIRALESAAQHLTSLREIDPTPENQAERMALTAELVRAGDTLYSSWHRLYLEGDNTDAIMQFMNQSIKPLRGLKIPRVPKPSTLQRTDLERATIELGEVYNELMVHAKNHISATFPTRGDH